MISVIEGSPEQFARSIAHNTAAIKPKGIQVYRCNLLANASRALEISFPTLTQLLGIEGVQALAALYYDAHPLLTGDWGEWGEHLAQWLSQQETLHDMPYLANVAQLDWLCHCIERAATPEHTEASIAILNAIDGQFLHLNPTHYLAVMASRFPLLEIWQAHYAKEHREVWLTRANLALPEGAQQYLLISREHWRASPSIISHEAYLFFTSLLQGNTLAHAINEASNKGVKTLPWLHSALQQCLAIGFSSTQLGDSL